MSRVAYFGFALATIALGLWVHWGGATFGANTRDMAGDALWGAMMLWWVSTALPRATLTTRSIVAVGICVAVELSQLLHAPAIEAVRQTTVGQLVLGSGFDARDLLAYAVGVSVAAVVDRAVIARRRASR